MFSTGQSRKLDSLENAFDVNIDMDTTLEEKSCKEIDFAKQALPNDDTTKKVPKKKMKSYKNVKFFPTDFV